jgi:hypothetical protein
MEGGRVMIQRLVAVVSIAIVEAFLIAGLVAGSLAPGDTAGLGPRPGSPVPMPSETVP